MGNPFCLSGRRVAEMMCNLCKFTQIQSHDNFKLENCSVPGFCPELAWICVNLHELLSIAATYWLNNKKIYIFNYSHKLP